MTAISVHGGADGITAHLDDLLRVAGEMRYASTAVEQISHDVRTNAAYWLIDGQLDLDTLPLHLAVTALVGPFGRLTLTGAALEHLASAMRAAVELYEDADDTVLESLAGALGHLAAATGAVAIGHYRTAGHQFFDAVPDVTDVVTGALRPLDHPVAAAVTDGHAVVTRLGTDTSAEGSRAPASITDLIDELAWRNAGKHGEISVSILVGADGVRRAIVDIPGTKSWNPLPNRDVTSVGTDIRALAGDDTSYEHGVLEALTDAGISSHDQVLLVGHSEGGIVAVDAARDAVRSGRFNITHVVTAGSPIGVIARDLPASVQVLALENSADLVPRCDGAANPDRTNLTTVTGRVQHYSVGADHDIEKSYEPLAAATDRSVDPSIEHFIRSAHGFLDAPAVATSTFWIRRRL
jgi:hypothetical protein